jgi:hypothetical protein
VFEIGIGLEFLEFLEPKIDSEALQNFASSFACVSETGCRIAAPSSLDPALEIHLVTETFNLALHFEAKAVLTGNLSLGES